MVAVDMYSTTTIEQKLTGAGHSFYHCCFGANDGRHTERKGQDGAAVVVVVVVEFTFGGKKKQFPDFWMLCLCATTIK